MAYKKLFEPGRIGGLTIRNRAVMSPMGTDLADIRGNATPRLIAYYTERAKGGIGLIINEYTGRRGLHPHPAQPADGPGLQRPGGGGADPLRPRLRRQDFRPAPPRRRHLQKRLHRSAEPEPQRCPHGARGRGAPGDDPGGHQAGAGEVHRRRHPLQEGGL